MIALKLLDTPLGKMRAGATDQGICLFDFQYRRSIDTIMKRIESLSGEVFEEAEHFHFAALENEMNEYFSGTRKSFDVPLHLIGSSFQLSVWHALLQIPYGETRSYKQQSVFLGNEKAIRAVASANGQNGIAIIVPCHRVIGDDGSLTGYGGGLQRKKWLLKHERIHSHQATQAELFPES